MPAAPLVVCRRYLIVVLRSLTVAAAEEEQLCRRAAEQSKFYPCAALSYLDARHHGSSQL